MIPKVSIIIPVYNVQQYLERCLNTVVNQTLKDIEIIIVNDDSKDDSLQICEKYQNKDSRIQVYSKKNEGLSLTRNYGLQFAKGEYVAFLDSDDYIDLNFYEELYKSAKENDADAVFTNLKVHLFNGEIIKKDENPFSGNNILPIAVIKNMLNVFDEKTYKNNYMGMCVWRSIYKSQNIKDNNITFLSERLYLSEDILFNIDFLTHSKKVNFIDSTYYYYCQNNNSLTHSYREDRFSKSIVLYETICEKIKKMKIYNECSSGIASLFWGYIRVSIKQEITCKEKSLKNRITGIKNIMKNEYVKNTYSIKSKENNKRNIIDFLIYKNSAYLIYFIYKIMKK